MIVDSLNILSQLSRLSKEYYEGIHQIHIYPELKVLIQHSEPCNILYFYILFMLYESCFDNFFGIFL